MKHLSIALTFVVLALPGLAAAQDFDAAGEQSMLARTNAMRAAQGLAPLVRHPGLDAAARAHCTDMAAQQTLTHVSPSSGTPADRVRSAGVTAASVAENVALHRTTDEAHQALLGSEAHRANMMAPATTHAGLAALRTDGGVYVTQVFATIGAPQPVPEPEPAPEPEVEEIAPALPAPSIELAPAPAEQAGRVEQAPVEAPAPPEAAPSAGRPEGPTAISPNSNGLVVLQYTPDRGRVQGYWVYGSGRWWYYPMPPGAQPGQHLQPDRSVQGPPAGFPVHPGARAQAAPPQGPHAYRVAPAPRYASPPPPRSGATITIAPGTLAPGTLAPGTLAPGAFFSTPPPPMVGRPTRAWRRAHRRWLRQYRRWQRQHRRRPL